MTTKIEGLKELERSIKKLGELPQKHVNASARKGAKVSLDSAKNKAPYLTGDLEGGIKLSPEKTKTKGKKVYQVTFDSSKNDIFQKKNKEGKVTGYYPASQEYGFFARNGDYIPGLHFLKSALESNGKKIIDMIVSEMSKRIEKAWRE